MTVFAVISIIRELLPEPHAGLLAGILFGTKASLPQGLYSSLVSTGTLHLVALSGMNISIITAMVSTSLLRFVSRRIASLLTIVLIIGFIFFVGPSPSVVRAGIMGGISCLGILTGRQSWSLYSLFVAAIIMIAVRPAWLGDISFQLSFLAALGIILFMRPEKIQSHRVGSSRTRMAVFMPVLNQASSFFATELRTTLAAQVFTIPVIVYYFHRISLVSPLTNILVGWTIPIVTVLGFLMIVLGLIWLPLAFPIAWVNWLFLEFVVRIITATGNLPFSSLNLGM